MPDAPAPALPAIDLTNYVPKAEFDKLQTQATDATKGLETLKNQLLDKDYLDFLEARRTRPAAPVNTQDLRQVDIRNLDMNGLIALIQQHTMDVVTKAVAPQLQHLQGRMTDVQAVLELEQVRQKYEDFDDFAKDVTGILERTQNDLTIEQAYLMAKAQAPAAPAVPATPATPPGRSERPGTVVPLDGDTVKVFKNSNDAAQAAASEVLARHGLSGDTI